MDSSLQQTARLPVSQKHALASWCIRRRHTCNCHARAARTISLCESFLTTCNSEGVPTSLSKLASSAYIDEHAFMSRQMGRAAHCKAWNLLPSGVVSTRHLPATDHWPWRCTWPWTNAWQEPSAAATKCESRGRGTREVTLKVLPARYCNNTCTD